MYNMLIAEDETFIRNAISRHMDWKSLNCKVVGETDNGNQAIELLEELKPDIVISDIRMFGKGGLDVCEYIYNQKLNIKVILITGFGELNYAQSAIKWNVSDFILKPIDPNELREAVRKAIREIDVEKNRKTEFMKLQKLMEHSLPALRERILLQWITYGTPEPSILEQNLELLQIKLSGYSVLALQIDDNDSIKEQSSLIDMHTYEFAIKQVSIELAEQYGDLYYLENNTNKNFALVRHKPTIEILQLAEIIQETMFERFQIFVSIGVSNYHESAAMIKDAAEEARKAVDYKFYTGNGSVIQWKDIETVKQKKSTSFSSFYYSIKNAVQIGNTEEAVNQLNKMWSVLTQNGEEKNSIKNVAIELLIIVRDSFHNQTSVFDQAVLDLNLYERINKLSTFDEVCQETQDMIVLLSDSVQERNITRNRSVVEQILQYLRDNYNKEVTLNQLGEVVYLNPKYVCRLLKQETGDTFLSILTKFRIEKAKELLQTNQYKLYEICSMIGISDARYFSQMFKKHVGVTPNEYRQKMVL